MSQKILISLVSDQTIPNILLIKELPVQDRYLFLTTVVMEDDRKGKTLAIVQTTNLNVYTWEKQEIVEDDFKSVVVGLDKFCLKNNDEIIVNITGGTKPMSLSTYEYFKDRGMNVRFLYKSATRYEFILLETGATEFQIQSQLSVADYLNAYGVRCSKTKAPLKDLEQAVRIFHFFCNGKLKIAEPLRIWYRGKGVKNIMQAEALEPSINKKGESENRNLSGLLSMLQLLSFQIEKVNVLSKYEVEYLTGGWFEELVYFLLKRLYPKADVQMGVLLEKGIQSTNNDLDVVMCLKDKLSIIECKTSLLLNGKYTQLFNETVYKAAAINKNFGLNVASSLYTLDNFNKEESKDFWEKSEVFKITLVDLQKLREQFPILNNIPYAP